MAFTALLDELANYVAVLEQSAEATTHAADRAAYTTHRAVAASMFSPVHNGDLATLRILVAHERRSFGWSYLSGQCGKAAEAAFQRFASALDGVE